MENRVLCRDLTQHNTSQYIEYITRKLTRQLFSPRRTLLTDTSAGKTDKTFSTRSRILRCEVGRRQGIALGRRRRASALLGWNVRHAGPEATLRLPSTGLRSDSTQPATARSSHTQNIIKLQQADRHLNSIIYTCLRSGSVQSRHQVNGKVQLGAGAGMRERGHGTSCK